ncbi:MAG: hypothetical protein OXK77_15765 [Gemmatimonadota bacterium]|nr:hypothetical protein [Gemmatimonadota bacterium]MDE2863511.1 hypothetical protein [Gemmatimonadota bacterium]
MVERPFLRSINVQLDVDYPERVEHFRPTTKSVGLISSIMQRSEGHALFVVAPYGSGKSIASAYAGQLVENRIEASHMLQRVERRLAGIDTQLATLSRRRREQSQHGLFVPLYGHLNSAPTALQESILVSMRRGKLGRQARTIEALGMIGASDIRRLLDACAEKMVQSGRDRIVIVWDEFGRHLQGLVSEGRSEELDVLQVLAEVVSRSTMVPVSLVLLLHRSLLGYAKGLPTGLRREWAKIEGRFDTLQYLDDSAELYELIGSLVTENRSAEPARIGFGPVAAEAKRVGLFPNLSVERLVPVLAAAYPLSPVTLHLLPRVAARVAQNERTIFSFLQWTPLGGSVLPSAIYEYFRGDFRTDDGAGGTQRAWLEAESALGKVPAGSIEEEALKTAFLLSLGLSGERGRATCDQLAFALGHEERQSVSEALKALIRRNLLVHRRHSDQVVLWHGTDVDLRGRLADEKERGTAEFAMARFLSREFPPPVWRPVEYNARFGIRRYWEAEYATGDGLASFLDELELAGGWKPGTDGHVLYVLPENDEESERAQRLATQIRDPRLLVALAPQVVSLREAALDLWCLQRMRDDPEVLGADPLVGVELDHLTDDVRTGLRPLTDRVLRPQLRGSRWFYMGREVALTSVSALRRFLSRAMEQLFPMTPEIHSEMVVRRKPSPVLVNARKKVALGLLERYGQEDVGIEGNFADKAIFRCVFLRTGLYRRDGEVWRLADPEELEGKGLQAVWARIRLFFTEPDRGKSVRGLLNELREPPYGVRDGVLPLLLAAGFKAFPLAATLRRRGRFVDDLLPSVIEDLVRNPGEYALDVLGLTTAQETYLAGVLSLFSSDGEERQSEDLLRACMTAVLSWRHTLPAAAGNSRLISKDARAFEREVSAQDPVALFIEALPRLVGATLAEPDDLVEGARRFKDELDGVAELFRREAIQALGQALSARGVATGGNEGNGTCVRAQASMWASFFPKSVTQHLPDHITKGVLSRLRSPYRDDDALVNALSSLLVGIPLQEWDDTVVPSFRRQLRQALDVIETTAIGLGRVSDVDSELRNGLSRLTKARARTVAGQLADILGHEVAAEQLEAIAIDLRSRRPTRVSVA